MLFPLPLSSWAALKTMFASKVARALSARADALITKLSVKQGEKYDKPESAADILPFVELHSLNTDEIEKPIEEYKTFNEFFSRKLKPAARPVSNPNDPSHAVTPADCRMMVFDEIHDATKLWIKGKEFTIENLLGPRSDLVPHFLGGSLVIARLSPQDYHRWHMPVTGTLSSVTDIPGKLFTVNPIAINRKVDVYTQNKRTICEIDTEHFGKVVLIAVGATMVGSISLLVSQGQLIKKGDCFGYFSFGGSTVLVLFGKNKIKFDQAILANSKSPIETLVRCNISLGRSNS